ncbi:MAG: hypothetical protein JNM85_03180 [Chthonomonas sp.]|nr:hypothetical protein [Chthonomonas sp.]
MIRAHIFRTLLCGIFGIIVAVVAYVLSKPIYEGRLEILLGDQTRQQQTNSTLFTQDVAQILNSVAASSLTTERQLLSSNAVFFQAVDEVSRQRNERELVDNWAQLYRMYDIETARTTNQQVDAGVALLKVRAYNAEVAAAIANAIATKYNEIRQQNARESVQQALSYLDTNLQATERELREKERALQDFKKNQGFADLAKSASDESNAQAQLKLRVQGLRGSLMAADARIAALQSSIAQTPKKADLNTTESRNPVAAAYEQQLATLRAERARLLGVYLEDAPRVKDIDKAISEVEQLLKKTSLTKSQYAQSNEGMNPLWQSLQQLLGQAKADRDAIKAELASNESSFTEQSATVAAIPTKEASFLQLTRDYNLADERYRRLKSQADDLRNRSETATRAALVLNIATPDTNPIAPDLMKFLLIGTIGGLCLGMLYSFVLESLKLRIQSSTQLTALTGLPVIASIPAGQRTGAKGLRAIAKPGANPPESLRYMAFSMVTNNTKTMRTFMFTGIKTAMTTYASAAQFAVAVAKGGTRVLLVDADMFQSPITKIFEATGKPGMSDLLAADSSQKVEDLVVPTVHENLMLLPGGTDTTLRFLTNAPQPKLEAIFQALRLYCDVVVVAIPPCDVLADASCIARLVDDVVLVVSAAQTNYRAVPLAQDLLNKAGAKAISIVMADAQADEEPFATKSAYLRRT